MTLNHRELAEQAAEAAAQQDKLARARAKIDAMHASLARKAEEKAAPAGATKMKRVTGGRSKVGEMDGLRAGLLNSGDVEENSDDKIARMVQEQREKAKAQRDAARARRNMSLRLLSTARASSTRLPRRSSTLSIRAHAGLASTMRPASSINTTPSARLARTCCAWETAPAASSSAAEATDSIGLPGVDI